MLHKVYKAAQIAPEKKIICVYVPGYIGQESYIFKTDKSDQLTKTAYINLDGELRHFHWTQSGVVPGNYSLKDACVALLGEGLWGTLPFQAAMFDLNDVIFSGHDDEMPEDLKNRIQQSNRNAFDRRIPAQGHFNYTLENSLPYPLDPHKWNFPSPLQPT